jgi:indolepyruvate ferredoxin oxidoreductase beta subunit
MNDLNVIIAGVGGQGTILACRILGNLGLNAGCDIKASEIHGMSQRGGSVITHVRIAERVHSPLIEQGQADYLIAFEPLEALRWAGFLKKDGCIIMNSRRINPMPVIAGARQYPEDPARSLRAAGADVIELDAYDIARDCGNVKTVNLVLLGVLASLGIFGKQIWLDTIRENIPAKFLEVNNAAFEAGYGCITKNEKEIGDEHT